jgi:hypothetical protein
MSHCAMLAFRKEKCIGASSFGASSGKEKTHGGRRGEAQRHVFYADISRILRH